MIPGADLLAMALSIMEPATVLLYPFVSRNVNAVGYEVGTHGEPITLEGSVQAVPLAEFEKLGLDLSREYITFYASAVMQNSGRDRENDYLVWAGFRWDIVNVTAWHGIDGWSSVLAVKVKPVA